MSERGNYIVIEGADGIGKTTQARDLLVPHLNAEGLPTRYVHEPGQAPDKGSDAIENIMEYVTKSRDIELTPHEALLAFTIGRIATWRKYIEPALEAGIHVVSDRNWLSSVAYQGHAGGLGALMVRQTTERHLPNAYLYPDFTILGFASDQHKQTLLQKRGGSEADHFESQTAEFQQAIDRGYEGIGSTRAVEFERKIGGRVLQTAKYVSFDGSPDEVHDRVWEAIAPTLQHR